MKDKEIYRDQVISEFYSLKEAIEALPESEVEKIVDMAGIISEALADGKTVFICGNGGSAADAQHIAGELVGRFRRKKKKGYRAVALTVNPSIVTALANDYGYDEVFSKQLESMGGEGDVLLALSTSGDSANLVEAIRIAESLKIKSLAFSGGGGGRMAEVAGMAFVVPAGDFARIQEIHMAAGHILCGLVESILSGRP
jgi:D-sedoheptulose 7-phosphate isomerase